MTQEREKILKRIEDAWLNIYIPDNCLFNPLTKIPHTFEDDPHLYILWLLMQPEYISFICKEILNIQISPMQSVILQELWFRKFPMLIQTRGGGKCISGNSWIVMDNGFKKIGDVVGKNAEPFNKIKIFDKILNENNNFNNIDYGWNNDYSKTIKLETSYGYTLEGTENHPIRVMRNGVLEWINLDSIKLGDYIPIDRNKKWFDKTNDIPEDLAYMFGLLVGDGGYTIRGRVSFTSCDEQLHSIINKIAYKYFNKNFSQKRNNKITQVLYGVEIWDRLFNEFGFNSSECGKKDFPLCILSAKKESVSAFICGLMDTDGYVAKNRNRIEFSSKSENLCKTLHFILTRFGIVSRFKKRLNKKYNRYYYYIIISGNNVRIFNNEIGFRLKRKKNILNNLLKLNNNTNNDIIPTEIIYKDLQLSNNLTLLKNRLSLSYDIFKKLNIENDVVNKNYFYDKITNISYGFNETFDIHCVDDHSFISNGFISHNSFLLALYALLRLLLLPGRRVVICGAAFRQSKVIFDNMEQIWNNAPMLKNLIGESKNGPRRDVDMCKFTIDNSYAVALPIGDGGKIRGQRGNDVMADEFSTIAIKIFEQVILGFGSVSSNPIEAMKKAAMVKEAEKLGVDIDVEDKMHIGNQVIISGTCDYEFTHFGRYWKNWKSFVECKGDKNKLSNVEGEIDKNFNYKHYSVIRIPCDLMPDGFMDRDIISRAKATIDKSIYQMEYGAVFPKDSAGFFKRSVIELCVANEKNRISHPSEENIVFSARLTGNRTKKYVISVDPASEIDNLAITVLELYIDHRRLVYCWTTNKKELREKIELKLSQEVDYYSYCARKIRDLMRDFPCERLAIDAQGGGYAIMEALNSPSVMREGEDYLWSIIDENKPQETDTKAGLHIIEVVQFANPDYTYHANHNLKKDFEDRKLLFPSFDNLSLGYAEIDDMYKNRLYDGMEDCVADIEELKNELATIVPSKTLNGRDRWDTPETKEPNGKKGRMRKDRYSALLMANAAARSLQVESVNPEYGFGRIAEYDYYHHMNKITDIPYLGNSPLSEMLKDAY